MIKNEIKQEFSSETNEPIAINLLQIKREILCMDSFIVYDNELITNKDNVSLIRKHAEVIKQLPKFYALEQRRHETEPKSQP